MSGTNFNKVPVHQAYLSFRFNQPVNKNSDILELGKLKLCTEQKNILYSATSGLPGFQTLGSSHIKSKGRIPTCVQAGISYYRLITTPVFLPNTKGVNGNFYRIVPYAVKVGQHTRSDLGIHMDRNVPGSAGCIVITLEDHWKLFEIDISNIQKEGIMELPLIVF